MARPRREILAGMGALGGLLLGGAAQAESLPADRQGNAIRLGALFPMTGPLSAHGSECLRGVELAVDLCNQAGGLFGRPVQLVRGDAADADQAVAEARRLVADPAPVAILGTGASTLSLGATEVAEGSGIPYWELSAIAPSITTRGFHSLLRVCDAAAAVADRAMQAVTQLALPALRLNAANAGICLLYANDAEGSAVAQLLTTAARDQHLAAPQSIAYQPPTADFITIARRLQALGTAIVIHHGRTEDIVLLFNALAAVAWRPPVLIGTSMAYGSAETAALIGDDFEGTLSIGVTPYGVAPGFAPQAAAIAQAYGVAYGGPPRSGASLAHYAGTRLFLDTLTRAGAPNRDRLAAVTAKLDLADGTLANGWGAAFGNGGQNTRAFACAGQWQDGALAALLPKAAAVGGFRRPSALQARDLDKT